VYAGVICKPIECNNESLPDPTKGGIMKILIIFNRQPYDNTDVTWNGLRLAGKLIESGQEV